MKKLISLKWAVALVAIAILGTFTVRAATEAAPLRHHNFLGVLASLGITDQQKEQIRLILKENQPAVEPLVKKFVEQRRALRELVHQTPVNEQEIRNEVSQLAATGADLAVKHAYIAERVRSTLTPEQVAKIHDLESSFDARVDGIIERVSKMIAE